jgi:hypothetical protein
MTRAKAWPEAQPCDRQVTRNDLCTSRECRGTKSSQGPASLSMACVVSTSAMANGSCSRPIRAPRMELRQRIQSIQCQLDTLWAHVNTPSCWIKPQPHGTLYRLPYLPFYPAEKGDDRASPTIADVVKFVSSQATGCVLTQIGRLSFASFNARVQSVSYEASEVARSVLRGWDCGELRRKWDACTSNSCRAGFSAADYAVPILPAI